MKKIFSIFLLVVFTSMLVGCQDNKITDTEIKVYFYTAARGTKIDPLLNVEPNSKIPEPEEPELEGYSFDGWFLDPAKTIPWDFENDTVGEKSITLFANWRTGYFRIYYDFNGGSIPSDYKPLEEYPEELQDPETNPELLKYHFFKVGDRRVLFRPTRTGYTFKSWYLYDEFEWPGAPEGTDLSYKPGDLGNTVLPGSKADDIYLFAHWDAIKISISFLANYPVSGVVSNPSARTRTYGFEFVYDGNWDGVSLDVNTLPDFSSYESLEYEFIGWNTRADGQGVWYREGDILERTVRITLFGQWIPKV